MMGLPEGHYRFDKFTLDPLNLRLTAEGQNCALEPKSFRLLLFLVENRHRVVPKEEILSVVWEGVAVSDNALTRAVAQIRKAFDDDPKQPRYIETVPTVGYRFTAVAEVGANREHQPTPAIATALAAHKASRQRWLIWGVAAVVLAAAGVGATRFLRQTPELGSLNTPVPFTTYPGDEKFPSFSPDGNQVAFVWTGDHDDNSDIYVKSIGSETRLRLTTDPALDTRPRWSPDGRTIAFERVFPEGKIAIMLIPPLGGRERRLFDFVSHWYEAIPAYHTMAGLSWSPDGKWLAVSGDIGTAGSDRILLVSAETGEGRAVSAPSNELGDYLPEFSPDGSELLFIRAAKVNPGNLYRLSLGPGFLPRGEPQKLPTPGVRPTDPEWVGRGREILFTNIDDRAIYRMDATGANPPVRIESFGTGVNSLALSRDGRRLAYSVGIRNSTIRRLGLSAGDANTEPVRLIASTRRDASPQYSPDGRRIAFYSNRSGIFQIWVCEADGSKAAAITSMKRGNTASPKWSPDGRTFAFDSNVTGVYQVYTVGADGGKVRQVTSGPLSHFGANWSRDGSWIYFDSTDSTGGSQVWKVSSQGGEAVQVTRNGGMAATESPDGKTLYYVKAAGKGSLWKMPAGGGTEEKLVDSIYRLNYAVTETGVYVTRDGFIDYLNFATGEIRSVIKAPRPDLGLTISPDGRYLLFVQVDSVGDDLMLVENFR
jgi:Tol biopolymer transport system component/DNA-binding winged helix-turn-helix (wHTH) protein